MPIKIALVADVASVIKGAGDVEAAFEDVADSLDDMARDAQRSTKQTGDAIDKGISSGAQDATTSVDRLERSFADMAQDASRHSKDAGDDIGRNIKRGTEDAAEGTQTFKENAGANAKEVAASFDGTATSIADGFQGLAAEALEGFGPAGLAAGVAIAAGIGLATKSMEEAKEQAQETAEEVASIASEMIDLGSSTRGPEQVNDALKEMASTAEDGTVRLKEVGDQAKAAGTNVQDYARGLAGDNAAAARSFKDVSDRLDAIEKQYNALDVDSRPLFLEQNQTTIDALRTAQDELVKVDGTLAQASETASLFNLATRGYGDAVSDASTRLTENNDALDANRDAQDKAAASTKNLFDQQTNLAAVLATATQTLKDNATAGLDSSTEAGRKNRDAVSASAQAFLDQAAAIREADGSQAAANAKIREGRDNAIAQAEALGYSADEASAYADQLGLIPTKVDTQLQLQLDRDGYADARAKYDGLGQPINTSVRVSVDTDQADLDLARWRDRQRSLIVGVRAQPAFTQQPV